MRLISGVSSRRVSTVYIIVVPLTFLLLKADSINSTRGQVFRPSKLSDQFLLLRTEFPVVRIQ